MSSDPFKGCWWPPTIEDKRSLIESPRKLNFATNWWTSFLFSPRYPLKMNECPSKSNLFFKGKLIFQPLIFRGHVSCLQAVNDSSPTTKRLKALFFGVETFPQLSHCSTVNVDLGKHHGRAAPPNNMPAPKKTTKRRPPPTSPGWNLRFQKKRWIGGFGGPPTHISSSQQMERRAKSQRMGGFFPCKWRVTRRCWWF